MYIIYIYNIQRIIQQSLLINTFAFFHFSCVVLSPQTLCDHVDCSPPGSSVHGDSPGKNTGVCCHALLQGIFPTQGSNPGLPNLQVDSLVSEPPRKSNNTGVGSLSLLQGNFQIQESNRGLLHWRQILYHLNYKGSPIWRIHHVKCWVGLLTSWNQDFQEISTTSCMPMIPP